MKGKVLGFIVALALAVAGCASSRTLIDPTPTPAEQAVVRVEAAKAVYAVQTGLAITRQIGRDLDQLPIPTAQKNRIDCGVLKVVGTSTPATPAVVQACGPVPLANRSPMALALDALGDVSTCAGLQATLGAAWEPLQPLLLALEESGTAGVRVLGTSLQLALAILQPGGVTCQ